MNIFSLGSATILTPTQISQNTFYFSAIDLAAYVGNTLTPGQNTLDALFSSSWFLTPLMPLGRQGPVESYHILVIMSVDNSAGEAWTLHLVPFFAVDQEFPLGGQEELDQQMVGTEIAAGTFKALTRTHPLSTATTTTLMYARSDNTATIPAGGGSELSVIEPQKSALVAPFLGIYIENTGATSSFTIQTLEVWGTLRG